jgi:3-carboxy-cis,cis-muconate cycloisomerase
VSELREASASSAIAEATSDRAWRDALIRIEATLARVCGSVGFIDSVTLRMIEAACADIADIDPGELGLDASNESDPVVPLVRELRNLVEAYGGASAASAVQLGATDQDITDTAATLIARDALDVVLSDLHVVGACCAVLAVSHRGTTMTAQTLSGQPQPTSFGAVAAGWGEGVQRSTRILRSVRAGLAVQLGGPAGTLAALHPHGTAVRAAFAAELGLTDPGTVWHRERSRIAELGCALGLSCAALGTIAAEILQLADLDEVTEPADGAAAATAAFDAARGTPGLVAALLTATSGAQGEAGRWHAEWPPLEALLTAAGDATARLAQSLTTLQVDADAMSRNLNRLEKRAGRHRPSGDVGHAGDVVDHYVNQQRRSLR